MSQNNFCLSSKKRTEMKSRTYWYNQTCLFFLIKKSFDTKPGRSSRQRWLRSRSFSALNIHCAQPASSLIKAAMYSVQQTCARWGGNGRQGEGRAFALFNSTTG